MLSLPGGEGLLSRAELLLQLLLQLLL